MGQAIASRTYLHRKGHASRGVLYSADAHLEDLRTEELPLLLEMLFEHAGNCSVGQQIAKAGVSYLRQTLMPLIHTTPGQSRGKITLKQKKKTGYVKTLRQQR